MGIMGTILLQATAAVAEAESEGGFGLNLNIFQTNLINLAILVGVLVYFGRKVLINILKDRRSKIETEIQEAEERTREAASALSEVQQKLTQAQAQRIRKAAEENAHAAQEAILARAAEDVQRLKATAAQDLNTQQERAIAQVRQQVVAMALQKVESELRNEIADDAQHRLVDRSIALLGGTTQ